MTTPRPAGGPPPQVLQWLHRVIAPEYQDPQRTYSDVATTLATHPTLSPRTSVYTHENGNSELMVHLFGTLPVMFRGATYNIPLAIWVPHAYPRQAPIAFVTPAKDMMIRPSNHVDLAGKCYHPYLANWAQHWERSNIVDLCDVLRGVFGREPPVMAKQQPPPPPPQQQTQTPPPRPPLPPELAPKSPPPAANSPAPPPPPPKELTADRNGDMRRYSGPPPPPPPHPLQRQPPPPMPYHSPMPMPYRAPAGSSQVPVQFPHPQPQPSYHPPPMQPASPPPPPPPPKPNQPQAAAPPPPQYQPAHPLPYQRYPSPQQHHPSPPPPAPPKPAPPPDLMDTPSPPLSTPAPSTPPPPPPNPEKDLLTTRIAEQLHALAAADRSKTASALSSAAAQRASLLTAQASLEREAHELARIAAVCDADSEILRERIEMAEKVVRDCRTREMPEVDAMVVAGSVVETQLYELVAEEKAIEDTIYVLAKALDRERIGLDAFLKHARTLAREQFLKKALIRRIAEELGIEGERDRWGA